MKKISKTKITVSLVIEVVVVVKRNRKWNAHTTVFFDVICKYLMLCLWNWRTKIRLKWPNYTCSRYRTVQLGSWL